MQSTEESSYSIIGCMSGTSLDGLDIAHVEFTQQNEKWAFKLKEADTITYPAQWEDQLRNVEKYSGIDLVKVDWELGHYMGKQVKKFCAKHNLNPLLIASHGHTVYHRPKLGFTNQIGRGAAIAVSAGYPTVCDFRLNDMALGGQGAPLVPLGDAHLFSEHDYCLNLGGIANISYELKDERLAYDTCFCNMVFNRLAQRVEKDYDDGGEMARSGKVIKEMLKELNELSFYDKEPPKTLGKEWLVKRIFPMFDDSDKPVEDLLATAVEHVALQIAESFSVKGISRKPSVYVTGGGAYNTFLLERIKHHAPKAEIIIPSKELVNFKEAVIFGFLGILRWLGLPNNLPSVTGASRASSGGAVYLP